MLSGLIALTFRLVSDDKVHTYSTSTAEQIPRHRCRPSPSLPASPPKLPAYPVREIEIGIVQYRHSSERPSRRPLSCALAGPILTFQGSSRWGWRKGNATAKCNVSSYIPPRPNSPPIGSTNGGTFRANFRLHCCALRCYGEDGDGMGIGW